MLFVATKQALFVAEEQRIKQQEDYGEPSLSHSLSPLLFPLGVLFIEHYNL